MIKHEYNVIGVMSGTSLDGIDLVFVKFLFDKVWKFEIISTETVVYDQTWQNKLKNLVALSLNELDSIDIDYTKYLANVIKRFIEKYNIIEIDAICSHGHTALHQPEKKLTYQIGNKPFIVELIGKTVVCDFRVQDVELGGQGAPLVPIGDELLFSEYDYCLNLGGFANISTKINKNRIAYDICPVNIVLNYYVRKLDFQYDDKGKIASAGTINNDLLDELNALAFYKAKHPKSLGIEWVNTVVIPLIDRFKLQTPDILKTFVEHIAIQLAAEINIKNNTSLYITGGGAYNDYLIERLENYTKSTIIIPSKTIIEFKEALIFAFLGVLKLRSDINCLQSVTGASMNHSSGKIYQFLK